MLIEAFTVQPHTFTSRNELGKKSTRLHGPQPLVCNGGLRCHPSLHFHKHSFSQWISCVWKTGTSCCKRLNSLWNFSLIWQVRFKLGSSDDEEDEEDSGERPHSEQDLCHPLCQCDKCSKWQKVSGNVNKKTKVFVKLHMKYFINARIIASVKVFFLNIIHEKIG